MSLKHPNHYAEALKLDSTLIKTIAPTGVLRASINLGNPLLAKRDAPGDQAVGISVDLATAWAAQLELDVELLVFDKAAESVQAVQADRADIGFFAIDPMRGQLIAFSPAYLLIEGCYMVRADSPLTDISQVDQVGHRVTVGKGSAYDLFLTRHLGHARIERAASSQAVIARFLDQGHEVAAGVKQQLLADAAHSQQHPAGQHANLRLLAGRFMVIEQAVGLPKSRGAAAAQALGQFVQQMKTSGFIAAALTRHRVEGVEVAL